uniref:RAB6-interacting golgin n=2 Tax=Kalanchoe fedtschenkoi TaxID=63787 RepID=A0A7N0U8B0_KALFE
MGNCLDTLHHHRTQEAQKAVVGAGGMTTLQKQMQMQEQEQQQQESPVMKLKNAGLMSFKDCPDTDDQEKEEMTRSALAAFKAKEDEIERKKMEVRERVHAQLDRAEVAAKRLAEIREELEGLADPMRKDVTSVRKRIDMVNKELKPLGLSCIKKEKEYKEALEAYNVKNTEKNQLVAKLKELVGESEKLRMKKLEELSRTIESLN